jgi:hypothetical protein
VDEALGQRNLGFGEPWAVFGIVGFAQRVSALSEPLTVVTPSGLPKLGAGLTPPADPNAYRKFRLITYHVVDTYGLKA